ncbi:hypothetical protein BJV82DRAFT_590036 [Fennellomyces sp. T-0311]|nr:hypothetical protein BJV82DRAFT_590036 [Fennellomyces sp. T-0311]
MACLFYNLLLIAIAISTVSAVIPASSRANHGCVLLRSTIYCYGGCDRNRFINQTSIQGDVFYSLDVSQNRSVTDLRGSWVLNTAGNIGATHYFAMAVVPSLNSFVIDGGYREAADTSQPYTYMYNATANQWNANIPPGGHMNVDSHTASTAPGNSTIVYINGGRALKEYTELRGLARYPARLTIFNSLTAAWSSSPTAIRLGGSEGRLHHKGAFGKDGSTIYYVGGIYALLNETASLLSLTHVEMSDILTYDTVNSRWGNASAGGVIGSPRMDHSLTLNPHTGDLIVYGGTVMATSFPIDDYFYVLNTDSMEWRNFSISTPEGATSPGPRFGHAGVLVGQSNLFIIFGVDSTGYTSSELFVLDIENWQWMTNVPGYAIDDVEGGESENPSQGNDGSSEGGGEGEGGEEGISTGALVGAIVGAVVGAAIIGAIILFFILRRRRSKKQQSETDEPPTKEKLQGQRLNTPSDRSEDDTPVSYPFLPAYQTIKPDGDYDQRIVLTPIKPDGRL